MVRRIRSCSSCCSRFVSEANEPLCSTCLVVAVDPNTSDDKASLEPSSKRAKVAAAASAASLTKTTEPTRISPKSVIDLCDEDGANERRTLTEDNKDSLPPADDGDDEGSASEEEGSEGGDDFYCTQLVDDINDDAEDEEKDDEDCEDGDEQVATTTVETRPSEMTQQVTTCNPSTTTTTTTTTTTALRNDDICFICGTSLTRLKNRIDHIKRCSKKHGITGRDVKTNYDYESFAPTTSMHPKHNNPDNPYTRESSWHGDAAVALKVTESEPLIQNSTELAAGKAKQTSLTSFFQAPIRNVNNVLIAGARRVSKAAEVVASRRAKALQNTGKSGRFRKRPRDYSKVRTSRE